MALTQAEIKILTNTHRTDISALNAIVKLIDGGASSADVNALLTAFTDNASNSRTPVFIRPTTASNIAVLTYDVAVSNVGTTDGTVLGGLIKPGETLNFDAGALNNFYAAGTFTYDATDTEFLIIYNS